MDPSFWLEAEVVRFFSSCLLERVGITFHSSIPAKYFTAHFMPYLFFFFKSVYYFLVICSRD